jgi:hypothetical protein
MEQELQIEIERKYIELNYQEGWRFLNCYKKNLESNNGIFIITLNPGARKGLDYSKQPVFSSEVGCSFLHEEWKSKTQPQFILFLGLLYKAISPYSNFNDFINSILIGYYIPFRSNNFKGLKNQKESIEFGKACWRKIIEKNIDKMRLLICIDNITSKSIKQIFKEMDLKEKENIKLETGWGKISTNIYRYKSSNKIITLVKFPHLGRFKIFGRKGFELLINKIVDESVKYYKN